MEQRILHILNGDSLIPVLKGQKLGGDLLSWREVLSRGPVSHKLGSEEFIQHRSEFLNKEYPESETDAEEVLPELWHKLDTLNLYDEVVCWFGQDYFCQINLMAILSYINTLDLPSTRISALNVDQHPEVGYVACLGNLKPEQLLEMYPLRTELDTSDLKTATRFWEIYSSEDAGNFNTYVLDNETNLKFLPRTIERHKSLFAEQTSGLNTPEKRILSFALNGPAPVKTLLREILITDSDFVFGDLQWMRVIDQLIPLLELKEGWDMNDEYKLSDLGHQIMKNKDNWMNYHSYQEYLGGANYRQWRRNNANNQLIRA